MIEVLVIIAMFYAVIGFFVYVGFIDNDSHLTSFTKGAFWFPLIAVHSYRKFWQLLKK